MDSPGINSEEFQFRLDVIERLTRIETVLVSLVGNGQPGTIQRMEDRLSRAETVNARQWGILIGIAAVISFGTNIVIHVFHFLR